MAVLVDFRKHLQDILDQIASDTFIVSNIRNMNTDKNKTEIVITALAGSVYQNSATVPYLVEVITNQPEQITEIFTSIAKEKNGKSFIEIVEDDEETKEYTVFEFYNTPSVVEKDADYENNHIARLVMYVNLNVLFEVSNVSKIEIDDEEIEFLTGNISYGIEPFSLRETGAELNRAVKKSSTVSLQISMVNKVSNFTNKVFRIMFGELKGNTKFNCKVYFTSGFAGNLTMILNDNAFNFAKNSPNLPSLNLTLTLARE